MEYLLVAVVVFLILLMWFLGPLGSEKEHLVSAPSRGSNYLRLYEDFSRSSTLFEFSNDKPNSSEGLKYMRYVLKGDVKAIDVNLVGAGLGTAAGDPGPAPDARVRIWNIRDGRNNASLVSDFYENTVYTTPEGRMWASENLDLLVDASAGEKHVVDMTGPTKKVLIEAYL